VASQAELSSFELVNIRTRADGEKEESQIKSSLQAVVKRGDRREIKCLPIPVTA
jgi:hypothetical protein